MTRKRSLRLLTIPVVLILATVACGQSDGAAGSTTLPAASSSTTTVMAASTTTFVDVTPTLAPKTTGADDFQTVQVFFASADQSDCSNTEMFERAIDEAADPVDSVFQLLVAGPTAIEQAAGVGSFFSSDTEGMVRSITVESGLLTVDFEDLRPVIPNASTSCGHFSLIAHLNSTAFQFEEVDRVTYQIEGNCETFFNWLQRDCHEYPRP